jgi:hypothetical protein
MARVEQVTVSELLAMANDNKEFRERLDAILGDGWELDGARTVRVEFETDERDYKYAIISWQ